MLKKNDWHTYSNKAIRNNVCREQQREREAERERESINAKIRFRHEFRVRAHWIKREREMKQHC